MAPDDVGERYTSVQVEEMRRFQELEWEIKADAYRTPEERSDKEAAERKWAQIEATDRPDLDDPDDPRWAEWRGDTSDT